MLAFRFRADVERQLADAPAPDWPWLLLCGFGAVLYYVTNGVALRAGSGLPLGVRVSTAVQCAAAAANRIIRPGSARSPSTCVSWNAAGSPARRVSGDHRAATVVCGLVHLAALALVAGLLGDSRITASLTGPLRDTLASVGIGPTCIAVATVLAALGLVLSRRGVRDRLRGPVTTFLAHLRGLTHSRQDYLADHLARRHEVAQVIALTASERAFGGQVSVVSGGGGLPGRFGGRRRRADGRQCRRDRAALAIGLTAAGGPAAAMVAAVLVYRLIGDRLPVIPGVIALTALRRRGDL